MRTSCNGCRVLRKGCSDDCTIRPCLVWIKSPEAQANATVFLAKFYGRAGLLNLLNAGPDHLRPAIFQSLLYEACGRVVDPVYGSVGLLYSGQWHQCQMAVDAVLKGLPIMQLPNAASQQIIVPPLKLYDIRHMSSSSSPPPPTTNDSPSPLVVPEFPQRIRTRARLQRRPRVVPDSDRVSNSNGDDDDEDLSLGNDSLFSAETTEEGSVGEEREGRLTRGEEEMGLDLTLGFTFDDNKYGDHMRSSSSSY